MACLPDTSISGAIHGGCHMESPGARASGRARDGGEANLIALLAILGVDLIVIAVFVLGRRRWLKRQPGEFAGRSGCPAATSTA
jgi:hypothetical protein